MSRTGVDYHGIYERHAGEYDAMVTAEDCDGHLQPALQSIVGVAALIALVAACSTPERGSWPASPPWPCWP